MRKLFLACLLVGISVGSTFKYAQADSTATAAKPKPTEVIQLHKDWFSVKFDDVRENTIIKTKDDFGPGSPTRTNNDDNMKMAFGAVFSGKVFDPKGTVTVTVSFNRMAGMLQKGSQDQLFGTASPDSFKPFKGNQLFLSKDCTDILLVLPSGQKVQVKPASISYKTIESEGFMGEKYAWEQVTISGGLDLLQSLQDGAKVALCDVTFATVKDQVSQARSLLAVLNDMGAPPAVK